MAKPASRAALKTRLATLDAELLELQTGARELLAPNASGQAAEGLSRMAKEMRKVLQRARDQGFVEKL